MAVSSKPIAAAIILASAALASLPLTDGPEDIIGIGLAIALLPMTLMMVSRASTQSRIIVPIVALLAVTFFMYVGRGIIPLGR